MPTDIPIRIAIIGAGVGGLVLATALQHDSRVQISVYEAQANVEETGAGIGCFGKSVQIINALGLADALAAIATCHPRDFERLTFRVRKSNKEPGHTFATRQFGEGQTFHRTPFLNIFRDRLPSSIFHYGKRLISYMESDSEVCMTFADGTTATCDLLIGCDGIRSAVRRCMFTVEQNVGDAVWSGSLAYRALFPTNLAAGRGGEAHPISSGPTAYCGQNKNIIAYPVGNGTMINMVLYVTPDPSLRGTTYTEGAWVSEVTASEILKHYTGWEAEVQSLLNCLDTADLRLAKWAIHEVKPLGTYVRGRVALLGDAAHAMQPHSGSGANQTIEDAYMLARLLQGSHTVEETLRVYNAVRREHANTVAESSARAGHMLQSLGTADPDAIKALARELETFDEWHKSGDVEADVEKALKLLQPDT
ncbi:FAD/NAD(P)-binding domain-containing protein [Auricularia subglabra TFB-10046 SS5]|nr:FAD/NAD(P)-binding domain-containing protein [Auricularia subglabra TFB-10046 SS5]